MPDDEATHEEMIEHARGIARQFPDGTIAQLFQEIDARDAENAELTRQLVTVRKLNDFSQNMVAEGHKKNTALSKQVKNLQAILATTKRYLAKTKAVQRFEDIPDCQCSGEGCKLIREIRTLEAGND